MRRVNLLRSRLLDNIFFQLKLILGNLFNFILKPCYLFFDFSLSHIKFSFFVTFKDNIINSQIVFLLLTQWKIVIILLDLLKINQNWVTDIWTHNQILLCNDISILLFLSEGLFFFLFLLFDYKWSSDFVDTIIIDIKQQTKIFNSSFIAFSQRKLNLLFICSWFALLLLLLMILIIRVLFLITFFALIRLISWRIIVIQKINKFILNNLSLRFFFKLMSH